MPASWGTKRLPRSMSAGATSAGSGCSGRNVEPSAETPPRVTRLNSGPSVSPVMRSLIPSSSSEWRGGSLSRSSTLTPHSGATGRQAPVGSTSAELHGPAATTTAPAGSVSPVGVRTPETRPFAVTGVTAVPSMISAPAARARAANACVAAAGGTGWPVWMRKPARSLASAGSASCGASSASARSSGKRAARSARVGSSAAGSSPTTSTPTVSSGISKPWPSSR